MKKNIKIMTYNILNGFHTEKEPYRFQKKRLEAAKRIVKKANPDILCLCEACFAGPNPFNIKMDYQKIFGFKYSYFASRKRQWGNMILSKYSLDKVYTVSDERFICLRAKVIVKNKSLYIDIIHPSPKLRERDVIRYLTPLLKEKKSRYILTGDFNALSDEDVYNLKQFKEVLTKAMGKSFNKEVIDSMLDLKLIPWIRKQRLIDVMKKFDEGFTVPTDVLDKLKKSPIRIDYFFISKKIKTRNAKVIRGKDAEMASDHYPIIMEIKI